jgi:hypothetical protein
MGLSPTTPASSGLHPRLPGQFLLAVVRTMTFTLFSPKDTLVLHLSWKSSAGIQWAYCSFQAETSVTMSLLN